MSESFEELDALYSKTTPQRAEFTKKWLFSGSDLDKDEWVAKYLPDRYQEYQELNRVAKIVGAEYDRQEREWRSTMSELEKLYEKTAAEVKDIYQLWEASGTHLYMDKWVPKFLPERLADYERYWKIFHEVHAERANLRAEKDAEK